MNELSLKARVRQVLNDIDSADPSDVTEAVFKRLPKAELPGLFRVLLREFVRSVMRDEKVGSEGGSTRPGRSWKRDAIRAELGGFREYYFTAHGWKHLRDCTREDLLFAANQRRELAEQNITEAERLEKLAARLSDDEQTVGDLDLDEAVT